MAINELLDQAGIYSKKHAQDIGMSDYQYKQARDYGKLSEPWLSLIQLRAGQHRDWRGFKIGAGRIQTPSGHEISKEEINQMYFSEKLAYDKGYRDGSVNQRSLVWGKVSHYEGDFSLSKP